MGDADDLAVVLASKELRQLCARVTNTPSAPDDLRRLAAAILGRARAAKYAAPKPPEDGRPRRNHGETARMRARVNITPARISVLLEWARKQLTAEEGAK